MARTKAATPGIQEHTEPYPCPTCATFVDPSMAICPSCGEVLKHSPRFAVIQTGQGLDWLDAGMPITAVVWALINVGIFFLPVGGGYFAGGIAVLSAFLATGIFLRLDWLTGIGKFICGVFAVRGVFLMIAGLPKVPLTAICGGALILVSGLLAYMIYHNED